MVGELRLAVAASANQLLEINKVTVRFKSR
jgi:hypothetical protein